MFCKHLKYKILKVFYGDMITYMNNNRQICKCDKFLLKFLNLAGNNFYLENIMLFTSKKKILSYNSQK